MLLSYTYTVDQIYQKKCRRCVRTVMHLNEFSISGILQFILPCKLRKQLCIFHFKLSRTATYWKETMNTNTKHHTRLSRKYFHKMNVFTNYSNDLYITVNIYTSSVDTNHLMCYIHTVTHYQYYGWWMSSHIFIAFLWTEYCLFGKILRANKYWWHSNRKALFRLSSQSE